MNTQSLRAEQAATGAILSLVLRNHIWVFLALTLVAFSLSSGGGRAGVLHHYRQHR